MVWWNRQRAPDQVAALNQRVAELTQTVERLTAPAAAPVHAPQQATIRLSDLSSFEELTASLTRATGLPYVTPESAMRSSAVYACVRLIAGTIAALPLKVYRRKPNNERELVTDHPVGPLLAVEPNATVSAMVFWETVLWQVLLRGNAYARVRRRGRSARPVALELYGAGQCAPKRKRVSGDLRLWYDVQDEDGQDTLDQDDVLHFPCFGWDGTKAFTPIAYSGQNAVGIAQAADEHAGAFFGNGGATDVAISYPKPVKPDQAKLIREAWRLSHGGPNGANYRLPAIFGDDAKITQLGLSAADAQVLETRKYQAVDIARIFGVPPHMIGETEKTTSWGSGLEEQVRGFTVFTLLPHLERMEQEINRKLFADTEFFAEFDANGLQRGDQKSRAESYNLARGGTQGPGWLTINEIRRAENLPPVAGGDELYRPAPASAKTPAEPPPAQP